MLRRSLLVATVSTVLALVLSGSPSWAQEHRRSAPSIKLGHGIPLHEPTWDIWNTAHISDGGKYMALRRNKALFLTRVGSGKFVRVTGTDPGDSYDLSADGRYVFFVASGHRFVLKRWDRMSRHTTVVTRRFDNWAIDKTGTRVVYSTKEAGALLLRDLESGDTQTVAPASEFTDSHGYGYGSRFIVSPDGLQVVYTANWNDDVMLYDAATDTKTRIARSRRLGWGPMAVTDNQRVLLGIDTGDGSTDQLLVLDGETGASSRFKVPVRDAHVSVASGDGRQVVIRREATSGRTKREEWLWEPTTNRVRLLDRSTQSAGWSIDGYMSDLDYTGRNGAFIEGGWHRNSGGEQSRPVAWRW